MKPTNIEFVDEAKDEWLRLNKIANKQKEKGIKNSPEMQLIKSIKEKAALLKKDRQHGQPLSKKKIPREFKKLGVNNLWLVKLTGFWRMLYTINGNKLEFLCVILKISDHKKYNKLLYKKKK